MTPDPLATAVALIGALRMAQVGMLARLQQIAGPDDLQARSRWQTLRAHDLTLHSAEAALPGCADIDAVNRHLMTLVTEAHAGSEPPGTAVSRTAARTAVLNSADRLSATLDRLARGLP